MNPASIRGLAVSTRAPSPGATRLPRGIGLLCAMGLSLVLWAGLFRLAWLVAV